ncbi:glutamate--cysteine ligase [Cycloclasticus sp.]|uniref:glutamate--cysteine ligase n=1 Tax=Cycloclasticus sp. TaxID=2024830 RepID=UPI000C0C8523|nr:glutamate--cysteine ligase [Cycloclasticus sp.]MBV1897773.1 glutamate--cysteine ligase [Cycloclasticus sp.]PHR47513.1 MAG: glutamate--cysteine ligase [Cycloclasticus sp.]
MYLRIQKRLKKFLDHQQGDALCDGLKGIEKESLRVTPEGNIAQSPHPTGLGSALTNPYITTDYSEALLEFITPPFSKTADTLNFMEAVHSYTYQHLGNEMLWGTSMPCIVDGDMSIPIANYGSSNIGQMKHIYRIGLWHRYGRSMQAIAGIHFNYSLPEKFWPIYQSLEQDTRPRQDFISQSYMDMARNLHRYGWLILYLFGASPAICKSFVKGQEHDDFEEFDAGTLYKPYCTSLRMSDIGYKNDSQSNINISYNSLDKYVARLIAATQTPFAEYEAFGVKDANGQYQQLNTNILQIENEYYSNVRPKQITRSGESPSQALKKRGIRYVELRSVDLNPFDPAGINEQQLHFLEAFMIFCLLADSPSLSSEDKACVDKNLTLVASAGRQPGLKLRRNGDSISLKDWGLEICQEMTLLCETLDADDKTKPYSNSLAAQIAKLNDVELTPSAKILNAMKEQKLPFFKFAMKQVKKHHTFFNQHSINNEQQQCFEKARQQSIDEQREIESSDTVEFDEFLERYLAQTKNV